MKTINEIMEVTECNLELATKLYNELTKLPKDLANFMSDNLDIVNAYNADDIEVRRHYDYSRVGGNIIVKRINKQFPTYLNGEPNYNHWKYCFDCLINYVSESVY